VCVLNSYPGDMLTYYDYRTGTQCLGLTTEHGDTMDSPQRCQDPREVTVQGGTLNLLAEYLHSEKLVICFKQIASILPTVSESCNLKSAP
jgi:hypothetical protein